MSKLTAVISSVLGVPEDSVRPEMSPENTSSWDSLNAIILLTEIEKAFDTRFEFAEAMAVKNVGDVYTLVSSKGFDPHA
jgi:acyl carrier protein